MASSRPRRSPPFQTVGGNCDNVASDRQREVDLADQREQPVHLRRQVLLSSQLSRLSAAGGEGHHTPPHHRPIAQHLQHRGCGQRGEDDVRGNRRCEALCRSGDGEHAGGWERDQSPSSDCRGCWTCSTRRSVSPCRHRCRTAASTSVIEGFLALGEQFGKTWQVIDNGAAGYSDLGDGSVVGFYNPTFRSVQTGRTVSFRVVEILSVETERSPSSARTTPTPSGLVRSASRALELHADVLRLQ